MIGNNTPVQQGRQIQPGSETSGSQLVRLKYRFMFHLDDGPRGGMSTFVCPANDSIMQASEKLFNHVVSEVPSLRNTLFSLFEIASHNYAADDEMWKIDAYSDEDCIFDETTGMHRSLCLHIDILDREPIEPEDEA